MPRSTDRRSPAVQRQAPPVVLSDRPLIGAHTPPIEPVEITGMGFDKLNQRCTPRMSRRSTSIRLPSSPSSDARDVRGASSRSPTARRSARHGLASSTGELHIPVCRAARAAKLNASPPRTPVRRTPAAHRHATPPAQRPPVEATPTLIELVDITGVGFDKLNQRADTQRPSPSRAGERRLRRWSTPTSAIPVGRVGRPRPYRDPGSRDGHHDRSLGIPVSIRSFHSTSARASVMFHVKLCTAARPCGGAAHLRD